MGTYNRFCEAATNLDDMCARTVALFNKVTQGDAQALRHLAQLRAQHEAVRAEFDATQLALLDDPETAPGTRLVATKRYSLLSQRALTQSTLIEKLVGDRISASPERH